MRVRVHNQKRAASFVARAANSTTNTSNRTQEVRKLLSVLPARIVQGISDAGVAEEDVVEIVLDFGRKPFARARSRTSTRRGIDVALSMEPVSREELDYIVSHCSEFAEDNRSGIDGTLHRISAIKNRAGKIVGITCRVGEAVEGSAEMVKDIVLEGHSVLLLGRPGVGKTTVIREIARILADEVFRRVVIVDTSNEIGGDGDISHVGIGRSRRMQVASPSHQHRVMIEAVENHTPNVIIIDEIGTIEECLAARTISQRGVQLIATAHGNVLENIIKNPSLNDVVGSISSVTLGDEESRRRGVQKSVLERSAPPTFDVVIEMIDRTHWNIHPNVADSVDDILRGKEPPSIMREVRDGKVIQSRSDAILEAREELMASKSILKNQTKLFDGRGDRDSVEDEESTSMPSDRPVDDRNATEDDATIIFKREKRRQLTARDPNDDALRVYVEGIDADVLAAVKSDMSSETRIKLAADIADAQAVLTTRTGLKENAYLREVAKYSRMPLFLVRAPTKSSVVKGLNKILTNNAIPAAHGRLHVNDDGTNGAAATPLRATGGVLECKTAIDDIVLKKKMPVEVVPNSAEVMVRLIAVANEHGLEHEVIGDRLRIMPNAWTADRTTRKATRRAKKVEFW